MFFPYRDENRSRSFPIFTLGLILLNIIIFLRTYTPNTFEATVLKFGFSPPAIIHRPYTLLTSIFLHSGLLHLISNMWFLWLFGDNIEDYYGRLPFLGLYVLSGLAGNFAHMLFTGFNFDIPVIGASGAVAGIMGSYFVRFPLSRIRCVFFLIFYPIFFRIYALWLLGFWMIFEFYQAINAPPNDFVAHWAHIGGFILGIVWTVGKKGRYYYRQGWWW